MKIVVKKYTTLLGFVLFFTIPLFANNSYKIANNEIAIIKVYDAPIGIGTQSISDKMCVVSCGVLPMRKLRVQLGKTLRIQVVDDKDIIVACNGKKGITVSRD